MPEGETRWRRQPERGTILGLRIMRWLSIHAPGWVLQALVHAIAFYFTAFQGRTGRDGAKAYFSRLYGRPARFRDRWRQTLTFAQVTLDRARLLGQGAGGYSVSATGHGIIEDHVRAGRGGVLLGAHFGSFEMLRAFDRTLPQLRVRYIMFQAHAAKITAVLEALNPAVAEQVIPVEDGHAAMLAAGEAISSGDFVAFLGDRMPNEAEVGDRAVIWVDFLGAPMCVPRAPYQLALMAGAPLILCFAPRTGARRYEISFTEIHDGAPVPRPKRDARCLALAQRYAEVLSDQCRRHPHNWFNFFDVWR